MIFVLLIVFIIYLLLYNNKNKIYLLISIWSIISVIIICCSPFLDKSSQCITKTYSLSPIQNDLDNNETYYIINQDSIIYYKTNNYKFKTINDSLAIVLQDTTYLNTVAEIQIIHSTCWRILTFDYSKEIVNSKFFLKQ
jgi:hypothetical protein